LEALLTSGFTSQQVWLVQLFDPDHIATTLEQLLDAGQTDPGTNTRVAAARRRLTGAD
jgi:hypothetical protein